jgi:hypothetical protein
VKQPVKSSYKNVIRAGLRASLNQIGYYSRPRFLIIGAQKGGTVSLYTYLSEHPNIVPASEKEIGYFDQDILYGRGESWYHAHFPVSHKLGRRAITFEATPEYLYNPNAAERIFRYDPRMKLIVLLREPVSRAFSAWNMFRNLVRNEAQYLRALLPDCDPPLRDWMESILSDRPFPDFDKVVREEVNAIESREAELDPGYVQRGLYHEQLMRYFRCFDRDQVLVIESKRLKSDLRNILREIVRFLDLPEYDWARKDVPHFNVGSYDTEMSRETRALLHEFYKPHNLKLYELLGRDLGW